MKPVGACGYDDKDPLRSILLFVTKTKLSVQLTQDDDQEKILNYIKGGAYNFGLDLFYGSVEKNLKVIGNLKSAIQKESESIGFQIPFSTYLILSPRLPHTGRFKRSKGGVYLKRNKLVTLTTNRDYANKSCHSFIYINARFLIIDVKRCDIIRIGRNARVQVLERQCDHLKCKVILDGFVKSGMRVRFPQRFNEEHMKITAEELEDITFAIGTNINVIVSNTPGDEAYYLDLAQSMHELKCNHFFLFTRLTCSCLENVQAAHWISNSYDGFLIDCTKVIVPDDEVVKLSSAMKKLMEISYLKRKPIFLHGCWTKIIDPSEYSYAFQFPDKYIVPCDSRFLRLFEAFSHRFCKKELTFQSTVNKCNALARSISAASFEYQSEIILVSSTVGEMATRISHFRPKASIIAITRLGGVINFVSMHHNTYMVLFEFKDRMTCSHKEETYMKLIHGMKFAISRKMVEDSSSVLLVFRQHQLCGTVDKFAVITFNDDYMESIRKVICS